MAYGEIARGLRDLKWFILGALDVPDEGLDVPGARTFEWAIDQNSENLDGDDTIVATALDAAEGSGTIEVARLSLAAVASMRGGTAVTTGLPGAQITTLVESANGGDDYGMLVGQAMSRDTSGSAYRVIIHKGKVQSPNETLANREWNTPTMDYSFIPNVDDEFISREQYEAAIDIPTTWV